MSEKDSRIDGRTVLPICLHCFHNLPTASKKNHTLTTEPSSLCVTGEHFNVVTTPLKPQLTDRFPVKVLRPIYSCFSYLDQRHASLLLCLFAPVSITWHYREPSCTIQQDWIDFPVTPTIPLFCFPSGAQVQIPDVAWEVLN